MKGFNEAGPAQGRILNTSTCYVISINSFNEAGPAQGRIYPPHGL